MSKISELEIIIDFQYNFKIRLANFKRVLSALNTDIHRQLYSQISLPCPGALSLST
ncbi:MULTISPECIES: hypothetical protein [unclassified Streptococcus]|uniref:hypothetical protein n=1 Tax=unclassified Streptococcus TaxID=2608887 RepID=UPI001431F343|nr:MULTISPECIES: hypothetical protein [unclassified Streptococcus]MBF0806618.1 hypothetical protein [Streptococcus sp. 19428wA2_WM07]